MAQYKPRPASLTTLLTLSWLPNTYRELVDCLLTLPEGELRQQMRYWFRTDLWALIRIAFGRGDFDHPWLFHRCRDVQLAPDGHLDLWARDHRKSTIITYAKTIQDILASHGEDALPEWGGLEPTFGIFSHTRPIAKAFLRQIKTELERNKLLHELFPDVLYDTPDRHSPRWSEDSGLVVKRASNPKEATLEAWGLVDGQPTGKHFNVLIYDDVVTMASVTTPEMIQKTTEAWEVSLNLGDAQPRVRMIGTRWHFADSYRAIMDRGAAKARLFPATDDGTLTGKAVLLTQEQLAKKIAAMGPYSASAQLLLNPIADSKQTFKRDWLDKRYFELPNWEGMNRALLVDPASEKKKTSDYTAMAVIGRGPDGNTYLLDLLRDRLNLKERADAVFRLHKRWRPGRVGYEKYGLQADVEYLKERMGRENYHFEVDELGGSVPKVDRINRLIPLCAEGRLWLPDTLYRATTEGRTVELIDALIEQEFMGWPVPAHDDMLDAISRIFDLEDFSFPKLDFEEPKTDRYRRSGARSSWMAG